MYQWFHFTCAHNSTRLVNDIINELRQFNPIWCGVGKTYITYKERGGFLLSCPLCFLNSYMKSLCNMHAFYGVLNPSAPSTPLEKPTLLWYCKSYWNIAVSKIDVWGQRGVSYFWPPKMKIVHIKDLGYTRG